MGRKRSTESDATASLRKADDELGLGMGGIMDKVARTFALVKVAEEEIREAKDAWPEKRDAIHGSFMLLKPFDAFFGKDDRIYRHYCAELLERVARGLPTDLGTKAEIMLALSEMSFVAPLRHDYAVLYFDLFGEVMGRDVTEGAGVGGETHEGATIEILDGLRKKARQGWRTNNRKGG